MLELTRLERYKVETLLGKGHYAEVYRARNFGFRCVCTIYPFQRSK